MLRTIRSFACRQGRMTESQAYALDTQWERFGLSLEKHPADFEKIFHRVAPLILEIGFGMGQSLLEQAKVQPECDFIGIEVHRPGVGALLAGVEAHQLSNVRVFIADAVEVLTANIPDNSLDVVQLFFPDPWPKTRHHKRRLVQAPFVKLIHQKLKKGGQFRLATDWENYAKQMMRVLSAEDGFINAAGAGNFSERLASRSLTKFEKRGQKLGHGVWDLVFVIN